MSALEAMVDREVDREIEAWSRKTARDRLGLLWDACDHDGVRTIGYWDRDPWSSDLVLSCSQAKKRIPGQWWAVCFSSLESRRPDSIVFSDDREAEGLPESIEDAWELRRFLEIPGIEERPELCELLIGLGSRRDDLDLPIISRFGKHPDRVVRYTTLGVLSWQPGVSNQELAERFREEQDHIVRDLADRFAEGKVRRKTRL